MDTINPASIARTVVFGGLVLGLLLGIAGQATRFCVRGAIADWVVLGKRARFAGWTLAVGVGAIGLQALAAAGLVDAPRTLAWSPRLAWASCLVGGLIFGYGMILAGGCPQRSLVKAGAGSVRHAVVIVVSALAAAMTLRGVLAPVRANLLDAWSVQLAGPQDLGRIAASAFSGPANGLRLALAALLFASALGYAWRRHRGAVREVWLGGISVGLLLIAAVWLTGRIGFVAEHPETLEAAWLGTQSNRPEGLNFTAPLANTLDLLTLWTDKSMVPTFGVMLVLGVLLGSYASAVARREFRVEGFASPADVGAHVLGAAMMGFGGVTALGCSIGNGVTGLAWLSAGSFLAVAGIVGGARLALARRKAPRATLAAA
ncbi:YeeE/YedE family protein [Ramlibacter sp.]|uniref:YeeE/YedE family protein n=1 Tax=Ramlibacter sp. TaxID=1917967 RepID=UPI0017C3E65A|nr:YeeE/YedE family protein [Ramlibacter sp.]MBA2675490.1 YeeE/YedE family protein [Ramlibacter sp.]